MRHARHRSALFADSNDSGSRLCDQRTSDAASRASIGSTGRITTDGAGSFVGWSDGIRLSVDNLVRNAVQHGRSRAVRIHTKQNDREVTIIVDDDGQGLPDVEFEDVLLRFHRGSTAAPGGSGLGLALVAQQAALHDGTIELSRSSTGGLRATLTIPSLS